jgi:hypothetical protein
MAHHHRRVTPKDRSGTATSRQGLQPRPLRLVHKVDNLPPDFAARKSPALEPYEDFDILLTAGHNIG